MYKCHSSNGRVFISRNVAFDEMTFPYNTQLPCPLSSPNSTNVQQSIPTSVSSKKHITYPCLEPPTNSSHLPHTPTPIHTSLALPSTTTLSSIDIKTLNFKNINLRNLY